MAKTRIQLSDHFTYKRLIRFVLPSIIMMIFTSVYGVVDGLFVSNYAGKAAFAAVNLIMPVPVLLGALGFMLGTGGSAIVAKTLGEGKKGLANQYFSMLVVVAFIGAAVLAVMGVILMRPLAVLLGADGEMLGYCVTYGRITLFCPAEYISELSGDGRASVTGVEGDHCSRSDKYGTGFSFCRSAASGSSGGRDCDGHQ